MTVAAARGRGRGPGLPGRRARAAAMLCGLLGVTGCGGTPEAPSRSSADRARPAFSSVAAAAGRAERPERAGGRFAVAALERPVLLRAAPGGRVVHRLGRRTEFGSARVLAVLATRGGWLRVQAPELPNGASGWIPADRATVRRTDWSLHVDRSAREVRLRHRGRTIRRMTVAVGRPGNPTPTGRFAVTDKLRPERPGSPYGCCIVALTGHQTRLVPGWPGGDRLAIHGTPQPDSVGRAVSLGCLRAHARELRVLLRRVPLGAPVFVRA